MKNTLFFALLFAGASAFAQQSDTTFTIAKTIQNKKLQATCLLGSFDMGEVNGIIYLFFRDKGRVIGIPTEKFPAPIIEYPEKNHVLKGGDFIQTDRYKEMVGK